MEIPFEIHRIWNLNGGILSNYDNFIHKSNTNYHYFPHKIIPISSSDDDFNTKIWCEIYTYVFELEKKNHKLRKSFKKKEKIGRKIVSKNIKIIFLILLLYCLY